MRTILFTICLAALAGCDGAVPDDYCDPCVGEVPIECEDVCSPPDN